MAYTYDPLGRPRTATSGIGSGAVTTTDTYNIQGWLTARTAQKSGGTNIFSMNLGYYSPVQSGAAARYSGDISSWTWTQYGQGQKAYAYTYDGAHRLTAGQYYSGGSATNALSEKAISYDRAGNITSLTRYSSSGAATTLSYSYTGNRRSTFAYDVNGNVTNDATNSLQTSYNLINLPVQTKSGSTVKANYSYLSDGAKASVLNASGAGYDYNGSFTYSHATGGTRTLESVAFGGGRIRKNGSSYAVDYYVTDHLGSVRAIVNASGAIVEQNDFYPFGTRQQNGLTPLSTNRWRFSGKEGYDNAFGIALDDFGARLFDRTAWTAIDPLAEKYYNVSPYAYCAGNPVRFVDPEGLWHWDANGNLASDEDDNAETLSTFFSISSDDANKIYSRYLPMKDKSDAIPYNLIWVEEHELSDFEIKNTFKAWKHYRKGHGEPALIGDRTVKQLFRSKEFNKRFNEILESENAKGDIFSIDMTYKTFHIGNTKVSYSIQEALNYNSVTFSLFFEDGFWDPNFILEKFVSRKEENLPDASGPNLEMGGTPYRYAEMKRTYFYRPYK